MHKIDVHKLADEAELNSFYYTLMGWIILIRGGNLNCACRMTVGAR
jgi:hypothetical protein